MEGIFMINRMNPEFNSQHPNEKSADIRLDILDENLREKDPLKWENSDVYITDMLSDLEPYFIELQNEDLITQESIDRIQTMLTPSLIYTIHDDMRYSVERYLIESANKRATGDSSSHANYPRLSLHITHNDADAYGCSAITILASALRNGVKDECGYNDYAALDIVINATAGESDQYCITTVLMWLYIFEESYPYRFIISDLDVRPSVLNLVVTAFNPPEVRPFLKMSSNAQFFDIDAMQVLCVDHHPTNTYLEIMNRKTSPVYVSNDEAIIAKQLGDFEFCATDISESINLIEDIYDGINLCTVSWPSFIPNILSTVFPAQDIRTDKYINVKVSAALLLWSCFRPWFVKLVTETPDAKDETTKRGYELRAASAKMHMINMIDKFTIGISQWDTFEWRDHPQYNTGDEMKIVYAESGTADKTGVKYPLYGYWRKAAVDYNTWIAMANTDGLYPQDVENLAHRGQAFIGLETDYMRENYKTTKFEKIIRAITEYPNVAMNDSRRMDVSFNAKLDAMTKDTIEKIKSRFDPFPEDWVICYYPHIGSVSIITERFVTDEKKFHGIDLTEYGIIVVSEHSNIVSFRTKSKTLSVNGIAKYYGGGGHPQAAGVKHTALSLAIKKLYFELCGYK